MDKIERDNDVVETIKNDGNDITKDILGKSNSMDDFIATLVNAMIKSQISIRKNKINLNAIADEEAYLIYAIDEARRKA